MKIGCNYFLETEQLLDNGSIDIDYFKYPTEIFHMEIMKDLDAFEVFCNKLTAKRPLLLHGLYPAPHDLSSPSLQADFDNEVSNRLIKITKTPGVSFHPTLSKISDDVPFEKTFSTIIANAGFLKERFTDMAFVSLENLDHIHRFGDLVKPEILTELLNETGCDLLLDISHAYCASRGLCMDFYDYLRKLPLEKTAEVHINGWFENENGLMSHIKIHEEAYQALKEVLNFCKPKIITVEYGRSDDRIGIGCPVMSPNNINNKAKNEIIEQVNKIKEVVSIQ